MPEGLVAQPPGDFPIVHETFPRVEVYPMKLVLESEGFAAGVESAPVDVSALSALPPATIIQIGMSLLSLIIKDQAMLARIQAVVDLLLPLFQKS